MKSYGSWLRVKEAPKAEWDASAYVLKKGEFGKQTDDPDVVYVKQGDGIHKWADLPWWGAAPATAPGP